MYLFFFEKSQLSVRVNFKIRILDVYFYIHNQKASLKYQIFPFYFFARVKSLKLIHELPN